MDSEEGNCPICTEVIDLTDRQFEPCNCGYKCSGISLTSCPRRQGSFFPPPVIAKGIQKSVVNGFDSLENSDSGASPVTTCDFRIAHGLPPLASVRASEGPHIHPNMSSNSVKCDNGLEVHSKAEPSAEYRRGNLFTLNNRPSIETQIVKNNILNDPLQNALPDMTLSPVPQAVSSSEDMPLSYDRIRKFSDLEWNGFTTKSEAKNMMYRDHFPTVTDSTIAAQMVEKCSTSSAAGSRISLEGHTSQCVSSERDSDDLESRFVESCNSKHFLVEKITVQGSVQLDNAEGELSANNILSDKAHACSKPHNFISEISSLDIGLADHLVEPHRLAKQFGGANKKGKSKERFDLQMASDGNESRFSSARMENDDIASGELFSLNSNSFDVRRNYNVSNNSEVAESKYNIFATKVENEFERPSLNLSAFSLPVQRNAVSCPPGFYPRYPADQNKSLYMPTFSGTLLGHSDQYHVNSSRMSYSENRFRSSTLNLSSACELLPSTISMHSAISYSNLGTPIKTDSRHQAQSRLPSFTQNSISSVDERMKEFAHNVAIQERNQDSNRHNEAVSGVTGISSCSETLITNNEILRIECGAVAPHFRHHPGGQCSNPFGDGSNYL